MELKIFEQRIDSLKNSKGTSIQKKINSLQNAIVKLKGGHSNFVIDSLQQVFADTNFTIRSFLHLS